MLSLLVILTVACLCACGVANQPDVTEPPVVTTEAPAITECTHKYVEVEYIKPLALKDGEVRYECSLCGDPYVDVIPMTHSLKVLAIGNSFSVDAVTYLWSICRQAGVIKLVVGNANIGGCSLDKHASMMESGEAAYTYTKYTTASPSTQKEVSIDTALLDEEWDIITIQQVSQNAGRPTTFSKLDAILDYVSEKRPNADIYWHMTWAYQQDSTHGGFANYSNDQMKMYEYITAATQSIVVPKDRIKGVIPCGTAMQNVRTSTVGDTITRDGYHASQSIGRYTLGLTWYAVLTGGPLKEACWYYPSNSEYKKDIEQNFHVIREAVANALEYPYEVTQSQYYQGAVGQ